MTEKPPERSPAESRAEELTLELLDGKLGEKEHAELEQLVTTDRAALRAHLGLLELEHALHAQLGSVDVSETTLRELREREARVATNVAAAIAARPQRARAPSPRRRSALPMTFAAAATITLVAYVMIRRAPLPADPAPPAEAAYATVTTAHNAELVREGAAAVSLEVGATLVPEAVIVVRDDGAFAARLDDGGTIAVSGAAELGFEGDGSGGRKDNPATRLRGLKIERRIRIERGRLDAALPAQPDNRRVVFVTPDARATVLGTRLSLEVSAAGSRLHVSEGVVLFEGLRDGSAREVTAGQRALLAGVTAVPAVDTPTRPVVDKTAGAAVYRWTFDDTAMPTGFYHGEIVARGPGPERPGDPFCVMGTINPHGAMTYTVGVTKLGSRLLDFTDDTVIEFDYWVGPEARRLAFQINSLRFGKNYGLRVDDIVRERWGHAVIRLADFRPYDETLPAFQPGDGLDAFLIMGGRTGGRPLYVDNLVIRKLAPEAMPAKSTANAPPSR